MNGDPLIIGSQAYLEVSTSDNDGSVDHFEIYRDNILIKEDSVGTYGRGFDSLDLPYRLQL